MSCWGHANLQATIRDRWLRLVASLVAGVLVGVAAGLAADPLLGVVAGWSVGAVVYVVWSWAVLYPMSVVRTREHARSEDPGRGIADGIILVACLASVVGVGALLLGSASGSAAGGLDAAVGAAGVATSWFLVPTIYTLRYADLYYSSGDEPVDFGGDEPDYADFYYLAFTLGMTYQVSDTNLRTKAARRMALGHSMLSYFLGVVVVGCVVNLVASLASAG